MFSMQLNFDMVDLGDSLFNNYEQVNVPASQLPNFSLDGHCIGTDSWIGKRAVKTAGGMVDFMNEYDIAIHIKTDAVLNESWNFYQLASNMHFVATVTNAYEDNVLGTTDSIKEITLNLFNEDNNNIMPHAFNGKKILLSKNKGFVQVYNLFRFPAETQVFTLIGNESEGQHPLMQQDLYDFEIGDYLVYTSNTTVKEFRIVTDKIPAADHVTYHFKKITRNYNTYNYVEDEVKQFDFVPGEYRLMGQFDPNDADYFKAYNGVTINYTENGKAYIQSLFFNEFSNPCWYWNSSFGSDRSNLYVEGLGFLSQDYHEWYENFDEWGNPIMEDYYTYRDLSYYLGSFEYGAYESPYQQIMVGFDKTESCDGLVYFSLPDAGIESALWHFGDGQQSALLGIQHTYSSQGNYNVSVDLSSAFGDTTLFLADPIMVGSSNSDHITQPLKMLGNECNEFIFRDNTLLVSTRTWTFPGGQTFTDSVVNYTFTDTGDYVIYLENAYGYCTDNDSIELTVRALETPIPNLCPLQSPSYSLFGFELNDVAIEGSYYWQVIESPAYDGFMNGCNQFVLEPGEEVNLRLYVGYFELIDVGGGNYDPWYTGYQFDVWIDYNNSGDFDISENVASSFCGSNLDIGAYNIYGYGLFTVPENAVRGVPLRMRLGANSEYNPCQGELYDFSVFIPNSVSVPEKQTASKAHIFPNPGKGDFILKLNNTQAVSRLDIRVLNLSGQEIQAFSKQNLSPESSVGKRGLFCGNPNGWQNEANHKSGEGINYFPLWRGSKGEDF